MKDGEDKIHFERGASVMVTLGRWTRPRIAFSNRSVSFAIGWFGFVVWFFDAECFWNLVGKMLLKRLTAEAAESRARLTDGG